MTLRVMAHWYNPFWDHGLQKGLGFKHEWCASENFINLLPMNLTQGANDFSSQVYYCAFKNSNYLSKMK